MKTLKSLILENIGLEAQNFHPAKKEDKIPGGRAEGMCPSNFDQKQLMKGLHVEFEHTDDIMTAMEVAMDHLAEDEAYYQKLELIDPHEDD